MRRRPLTLGVALLAVLTLTAVSCGSDHSGIEVGEVGRADVAEVVDAPATVVAHAAATLTAVADGTLTEVEVAGGDEVEKGDILAVIDSPAAERQLEQATEALDAATQAAGAGWFGGTADLSALRQATDAAAETAFDQARTAADHLADKKLRKALLAQVEAAEKHYTAASVAAGQAVRAVQNGVASLSSAVAAMGTAQRLQAQQAYDLAKATVDALTLRAPIDGVVQLGGTATGADPAGSLEDLLSAAGGLGSLPATSGAGGPPAGVDPAMVEGAQVTAGAAVLTVVDVADLGLVAEVDETDILLVQPGVEADVELDAALSASYPATVTAVDVLPTQSTRGGVAYRVRLTLAAGGYPDGADAPEPLPGMSAVAHLNVRQATDTLAVPAAALLRVDSADVVWTVRGDRAVRTPVTVGVQGQDVVQVVSGLGPGDRIVVRGADLVQDGQRLP